MPHSPNVTAVPPVAAPWRSGWCCLRCLTRRGVSTSSALRSVARLAVDSGRRRGGAHLGLAGGGGSGGSRVLTDTGAGRVAAALTTGRTGAATAPGAAGSTLAARRARGGRLLARQLAL